MSSALEDSACKHLNDGHRQQVIEYLRYFRSKRDQHLNEVQRTFDEVKDTRMFEDLYTHEDVVDIFEGLRILLNSNIGDELDNFSRTSVLVLRQLFLQAEGQRIQLRVETSKLDDEVLLRDIDKIGSETVKDNTVNLLNSLPSLSKNRLGAIGGATVDTGLVMKIKELTDENERYCYRLETMKTQLSNLTQSNTTLQEQVKRNEVAIQIYKDENTAGAASAEVAQLRAQLHELRSELADCKKSLDTKVSLTPQFQELKKIVTKKNVIIKAMRSRLTELDPKFSMDSI